MKLGIAIAAKRPIMATTIIISTNVKPDLREVLIFILYVFFLLCGVNEATGGLYNYNFRSLMACRKPLVKGSIQNAKFEGSNQRRTERMGF